VKARWSAPILGEGVDAFPKGRAEVGLTPKHQSMSVCRAASITLRHPGTGAIRFLLFMVGIVAASMGAAWFLTDPAG
jgi:hypothetical protein